MVSIEPTIYLVEDIFSFFLFLVGLEISLFNETTRFTFSFNLFSKYLAFFNSELFRAEKPYWARILHAVLRKRRKTIKRKPIRLLYRLFDRRGREFPEIFYDSIKFSKITTARNDTKAGTRNHTKSHVHVSKFSC